MIFAAAFLAVVASGCSDGRAATTTTQPSVTSTASTIFLGDVGEIAGSIGSRVVLVGFVILNDEQYELCGVIWDTNPPQCGSYPVLLLGLQSGVENGSYIQVHGTWENEGIRVDFTDTALGDR